MTSFRLSAETYELLKKNRDFYESLFDLQKKKESPLLPKATDAESRTESKVRDNGDVEVSVILPVDDNADPADGRIYVRDTFVFDPSEKVLKSYQRNFEHNGKGGDEWKGWLGKYQALPESSGRAATDPTVQKFAHRVVRSYGRPITEEKSDEVTTLPEIKAAFEKDKRLLATTNQQILDANSGLAFKIKDKLNFYSLAWKDGKLEVTINFAVDDDSDVGNGRILLKDKYTIDAKTLAFEGLERNWSLAPGAEADARYPAALRKLQTKPNPSAEEASAFINNLLPVLLPKGEPDGSAVLALLGAGKTIPKDYQSPFAKRGKADPEALKAGSAFSLEAMYVLAQEQVMKRHDESQGWLHFGAKVDHISEKSQLEGLFQKAKAAHEKSPGTSPFVLMQSLELSEAEKDLRDRLLGDKLMIELDTLAQEPDAKLRGHAFAILAQERMLIDAGLAESAVFLAEQLKKDPETQRTGEDILAIVQGKGDFGQKVGYVLPLFSKEVSKPSMLLGMAAAPFMGTAFELGALKSVAWAYDAKKISDIGRSAKLGAAIFGMTGEAIGFTAIHRGFERLHHSGDKAWNGAWQEILSATMLFGGMRLTHGATGLATARMAEGAWGSKLGYRFGEAEFAGALGKTPTGRFLFDRSAAMAGKGIPTLTTKGQVLSGTMNHLGGILTMQASGALSRKLGLQPDNQQSFGANFFDATVMYAQAMVGSHAANMASGGSLHRTLGEFKMGVENLRKGITPPPAGSAAVATPPPAAPDPNAPAAAPLAKTPSFIERLFGNRKAKQTDVTATGPTPTAPSPTAPAVVDPAAAPVAPKPPSLFERLFGDRGKSALSGAREWLGNLAPSKVKALEAELAEMRTKKAEVEQRNSEKDTALSELQQKLTELKAQKDAADAEVAAKKTEIEGLKNNLTETEGKQKTAEALVAEKTEALNQAEAKQRELEAKKTEAEQKLQDYTEQAELSELDLGVGDLNEQIISHKAELGKLRAERRDAETQAGAFKLAADELREQLTKAEVELERRKSVDKALTESEQHVADLESRLARMRTSIATLETQVGDLTRANEGASRLTTDQAQKLADLEALKTQIEGKLTKALVEITGLRGQLSERIAELSKVQGEYEDVDAQLRSANRRISTIEASIQQLEANQTTLEADKTALEQEISQTQGAKGELQTQLEETTAKLKATQRELGTAKHDLEISAAGKKALKGEADRLREQVDEATARRNESETKLRQNVRDLETQLKDQGRVLDTAQKEILEVGEKLTQQTERATAAEGRETELRAQHATLEAEHSKAQEELGRAQRRIEALGREVEAKKAEIERQKTNITTLKTQIEGFRTKKTEMEEDLRKLRVDKTLADRELETVRAELEAERAKEPETIEDLTQITELGERIEALELEKVERDRKLAGLEAAKIELDAKVTELETSKREVERKLRSTETDLENASGAAKSAAEDLVTAKERAQAEEARMKASIEEWRSRATEAEAAKTLAEAKIRELDRELNKKKDRIAALERETSEKSATIKQAEGVRAGLEADVKRLEEDIASQKRLLEGKELEINRIRGEFGDTISALEAEKAEQAQSIREKQAEIVQLEMDVETKSGRIAGLEIELMGVKAGAERAKAELEADKAQLAKDLAATESELRQRTSDLINSRARIEELDGEIRDAAQALRGAADAFEIKKAELEGKITGQEKALAEGRSAIETSEREVEQLKARLETTRQELETEQAAAREWKKKFETLEVQSEAEVKRLRREAAAARNLESEATKKATEAEGKVVTLEGALAEVRRLQEEQTAELAGQLSLAEQRAAREENRAGDAEADLERVKVGHAAEAARLRQEASENGKAAAIAEGRATELQASLDAESAKLRTVEADLAAAKAEAEALLAPASLRAAAEQKATDARHRAAQLQETLTAAEQGKIAAEQKVTALEKDLAALRSQSEGEAEQLRTEAETHRARAVAAESRATAAELRASQLEIELKADQLKIGALRSDAAGKSEAEASLKIFENEIAGLKVMVQEAESRAAAAERQAAEFENALTASEESAADTARKLGELTVEHETAQVELTRFREKIARLEPQLTEASQKRKDAEQKLLGAQTRAAELESQVLIKDGEIGAKTKELETAKGEIAKMWQESQAAGAKAQVRIGELEAEVTLLKNQREGLEEQVGIEQAKVRDVEATHELLVQSETALRQEIDLLKVERNAANVKSAALTDALMKTQAEIDNLEAALDNQQAGGFRFPHESFSGADPRLERVETKIQATALIGDAQGKVIGEAHLCAGGEEGLMQLRFADESRASGRTTIGNIANGNGKRKSQDDSIYMSRILLPDGTEMKILAGADGAGGMGPSGAGAVASSAFLQGLHSKVVEIAREGRVPTAQELFDAGVIAVKLQREQPDRPQMETATGAGAVVVIIGNEAMVASAGDASVFVARPNAAGEYDILGYTNAGVMPVPNGSGGWQYNHITQGIHQHEPRVYRITDLQPRDRILIGSDGFHENTSGVAYKERGSMEARQIVGHRPPTQDVYTALRSAFKATAGMTDSAAKLHDLALENIRQPGRRMDFYGETIQLPLIADKDNILVIDYEHGQAAASKFEGPLNYSPMEPVPTAEQIRAAEMAAERSTAKGFKMPAPSTPPTDPHFQPRISERQVADFYVKYVDVLTQLYGTSAEKASQKMLQLYLTFPELEEVINPSLLARAEDKQQQGAFFDAAVKKIDARNELDKAILDAAKADLETIKKFERPFVAPEAGEVLAVKDRYVNLLHRMYGEDLERAAELFAGMFKTFPQLEARFGPEEFAKVEPADFEKFYKRKLRPELHRDKYRFNEGAAADAVFAQAEKFLELHKAHQDSRKMNGWGTAESVLTGLRVWQLDTMTAYQVGKNGDSNIKIPEQGVSRKHFKLYAQGNRWVIEDIGSTYGTFINGQQVQRAQLKDGDRIQAGVDVELQIRIDPNGSARLVEQQKKPGAGLPGEPQIGTVVGTGALQINIFRGRPVTLGRKHISDAGLSQEHVEFIYKGDGWMVRDMGSDTGTQLNGVDIQSGVDPASQRRILGTFHPIKNGSFLTMGGMTFRFHELPDQNAALVQVAGQAAPPSSHQMRTPPPQVARLNLAEGGSYKFNNPQAAEVAEIFWDGFENGGGEFVLKETGQHGQVWILNGNRYEALAGNTYAMGEGLMFGFGPSPDQSQWYLFKDGAITAVQYRSRSRASTEPMEEAEVLIEYPPSPQPIKVGRNELGGSSNISTEHLGFIFHEKAWYVKDLGSSNGTYHNHQLISKGKGHEGDWKPIATEDILTMGGVTFRFQLRVDGGMRLEQIAAAPVPMEPLPVSIPPSYMPPPAPQALVPPNFNGRDVVFGWTKVVRIVETKGEVGLHPTTPEEPTTSDYYLNIAKGGVIRGWFEKDLARIEDLGNGRYKVENIGFKKGMSITNARGKDLKVALGRSDYASAGDTVEFNGQSIILQP